jgi:hypothetical protein
MITILYRTNFQISIGDHTSKVLHVTPEELESKLAELKDYGWSFEVVK